MENDALRYRRKFDRFQLLYPIVPAGVSYAIIRHAGCDPFEVQGFWIFVTLIAMSQGICFIVAKRSPDRVDLTDSELIVGWTGRKQNLTVPKDLARIRKSYLFNGRYWVSGGDRSFYIFPNRSEGREILEALRDQKGRSL